MLAGSVAVGLELGGLQAFVSGWKAAGLAVAQFSIKVAKGIASLAADTARAGDNLQKMAQRVGWSSSALSEMDFALSQSGVSLGDFDAAMRGMTRALRDARDGGAEATRGLKTIGVTLADLKGLDPEQTFEKMAEGLRGVSDHTVRAGAAMQLFGRSGMTMLPLLNADIGALRTEARRLGDTFSEAEANMSASFVDEMDRASRAVRAVGRDLGKALMPYVRTFFTFIANIIPRLRSWVQNSALLGQAFQYVQGAMVRWGNTIKLLSAPIGKFFSWIAKGAAFSMINAFKSVVVGVEKMQQWAIGQMRVVRDTLWSVYQSTDSKIAYEAWSGIKGMMESMTNASKAAQSGAELLATTLKISVGGAVDELAIKFPALIEDLKKLGFELVKLPDTAGAAKGAVGSLPSAGGAAVGFLDAQFAKLGTKTARRVKAMGASFGSTFTQMKQDGASMGDALAASVKQSVGQMAVDEGQFHFLAGLAQMFQPGQQGAGVARMAKGALLMSLGASLGGGGGGAGAAGSADTGAGSSDPAPGYDMAEPEREKTTIVLEPGGNEIATAVRLVELLNELDGHDVTIKKGLVRA